MAEPRPRGGHKARVLIVDDEETVRQVISAALADLYEMDCFHNGSQVIDRFTPGHYQVAIIDLYLPGISGEQVARAIRSADPRVAIVGNTGRLLLEDDPMRGHFDFWLEKPFNISRLREVVARGIKLYNARYVTSSGLGADVLD